MTTWPILLAGSGTALASAALRRLTGMGFAMVCVAFLSLILPPSEAVMVTIVLQLALGVRNIDLLVKHADWRVLPTMIAAGIVAAPIGFWFTSAISEHTLRLFIGICVLFGIVPTLFQRRAALLPGSLGMSIAGFLAGFLNSVAAMPAPPLLIYFMGRSDMDIERRRATLIAIFTLLSAISLAGHAVNGSIDRQTLIFALLMCPATLLGDYLGRRTPWSFNRKVIDTLSAAIVVISAATLIASTIR